MCFKVETHNHPSAVEPYGGAATGIGGVVRDSMGTGLSAKPILIPMFSASARPICLTTCCRRASCIRAASFKGVRAGVADYGNRLGIPTLNGAIFFDERYTANPLVFCGTVGIMPERYGAEGASTRPATWWCWWAAGRGATASTA